MVKERDSAIDELDRQVKLSREAAAAVNKMHNDYRVKMEKERFEVYHQHKKEVKMWRRDLGDANRQHINLEKKLKLLRSNDEQEPFSFPNILPEPVTTIQNVSETYCSLCAIKIDDYLPDYFYGEKMNPACSSCKEAADTDGLAPDPFKSFPLPRMPISLVTHWTPSSTKSGLEYGCLSSLHTMRSHYVKLPNPGEKFTAMEDLLQEFRLMLKKQREEMQREQQEMINSIFRQSK